MSIPQTPIRYYVEGDPYYWSIDNRPLTDLAANQATVASMLNLFLSRGLVSITSTSGAVISAGQVLTGNILRSGPLAGFSDTTDSAFNILAMIPNVFVGLNLELVVANTSGFTQTLLGGSSVTISGVATIASNTSRKFILTVTNVLSPALTLKTISSGGV
jgi:hypothetical protein